jgi:putative acyl-CoA dehydrogenase
VICLDALRAFARSGEAVAALEAEVVAANDPRITGRFRRALRALRDPATAEPQARAILEALAVCVQASLMKRHSDPRAAEAFAASRFSEHGARSLGTLELDVAALNALADRARLAV